MMGKFEKLNSLLKSFIEKGPAGCACSIVKNGETLYQECFGYTDLDTKKPITPDTIYRIYSMTKIITCTAALMLYERGLYQLNDPLEEYLPEFRDLQVYRHTPNGTLYISPAAKSIQIKNLFTMTSGLTYGGEQTETARHTARIMEELKRKEAGGEKYDLRALSKALASVPLAFDPGTHWLYGYSHDVLAAFIEAVSGKKFSQLLKDEIFEPLGMKDTFFRLPEEYKGRLCTLYNRSEDGKLTKNTSMDAHIQPDAIFESGGGGLLSTLEDYSRFGQMLTMGGELDGVHILGRKTIELMTANHLNSQQMQDYDWPHHAGYGYGLGVRVMVDRTEGGSNSSAGEFGWAGVLGTWSLMDPKEGLTAVSMHQLQPNLSEYFQPRIRTAVYASL